MPDVPGDGAGPDATDVGDNGGDSDDITPAASNDWWQFGSKDDAEKWANDLVTKRLARHKKSTVDPIVQERDTLKTEVERLRPLEDATKTDVERRDARIEAQDNELKELRQFKATTEHSNLVRNIAEELGLPAKFVSRVRGDDEDAIREDITDLLNVLSEGGSNTGSKKTPTPKAPKGDEGSGGGKQGSGGGGSSQEQSDASLVADILDTVSKDRRNGGLHTRR